MFLTEQEVAELTGYTRVTAQLKWLEANRYGYAVGGDGKPKVLREVVLARLGGFQRKKEPQLRLK